MKFLSSIFGGKKDDRALHDAFAKIRRIIEDEQFQLEMVPPAVRTLLESCPAYDKAPDGTGPFGFTETNPIPVNGPIGQLAYLSKLETLTGQRVLFHRIGAIDYVDVFEAVSFDGSQWFILFVDLYHPRRSRLLPEGFKFTTEVAQFSGFHKFCENFPYDFPEMKATQQESGLSLAYIPISKVSESIRNRAYNRPLAHKAKLELVNSRLSSSQTQ